VGAAELPVSEDVFCFGFVDMVVDCAKTAPDAVRRNNATVKIEFFMMYDWF